MKILNFYINLLKKKSVFSQIQSVVIQLDFQGLVLHNFSMLPAVILGTESWECCSFSI